MSTPSSLTTPFCTKDWANLYFSESSFSDVWTNSSDAKKTSALQTATNFIDLYVTFYDEDGEACTYTPDGTDDWEDKKIPKRLKQACAQEASYLLSLDDNPAEPHPLTILGMLSADGKKFDTGMTAPIFSKIVISLLGKIDCDIDGDAMGNMQMQVCSKQTVC